MKPSENKFRLIVIYFENLQAKLLKRLLEELVVEMIEMQRQAI